MMLVRIPAVSTTAGAWRIIDGRSCSWMISSRWCEEGRRIIGGMIAGRCRTRGWRIEMLIIDVNEPLLVRASIAWPAGIDDWLRRTGRAAGGAETTGDFVVRRCRRHVGDRRQATIDERSGGKKARRSLDDRRLDCNKIKCYTIPLPYWFKRL